MTNQANVTRLVRVPAAFYDDHADRELSTPVAVRRTARHVWVDAGDVAVAELLDDARHYAHVDGPDMIGAGLRASARATVRALQG